MKNAFPSVVICVNSDAVAVARWLCSVRRVVGGRKGSVWRPKATAVGGGWRVGGEINLAVATANGLKSLSFHRAVEEGEAEERRA